MRACAFTGDDDIVRNNWQAAYGVLHGALCEGGSLGIMDVGIERLVKSPYKIPASKHGILWKERECRRVLCIRTIEIDD